MESNVQKPQGAEQQHKEATQQVSEAHQLLKSLRSQFHKHPELDEAILKLENALSILTLQTGGML